MLSVIICTYNRGRYIYNVLQSIAIGSWQDYEIVLVNNNSTDNTDSECRRFCSDYPDVRFNYYHEPNQGLSYARNCGINNAKGDVLVYVDDDALVNPEYLATYAAFFAAHPEAQAAGGPILPQYDGCEEPDWMSHYTRQLITGRLYLGEHEREFPRDAYPGGGNAAYRSEVFQRVGLFNVELGRKGNSLIGAEEKDIFDKMTSLGMRFYYLPTAILYHLIPPHKLTQDYFDRLTLGIGASERRRTLQVSRSKYLSRIAKEGVKWAATLLLWTGFALRGQMAKGQKLVAFRRNVTRGLLKGDTEKTQ
ncbi:MAG: glycosyltransferase family 2 protein [Bacteroidales bacterium]|nr:glycosyltransferase family 2 protein [Bacteroidales bacterium]